MTHIRKPNRRVIRALNDAAAGTFCLATGKVVYSDEASATRAAAELSRRSGEELEAYICRDCSDWHIGHAR